MLCAAWWRPKQVWTKSLNSLGGRCDAICGLGLHSLRPACPCPPLQVVIGRFQDGSPATFGHFNYFMFAGKDAEVWSPRLFARLAHAGFFTITTGCESPEAALDECKKTAVSAPAGVAIGSAAASTAPVPWPPPWGAGEAAHMPLAELQPFYGVVVWRHFEASGLVRQSLAKLKRLQDGGSGSSGGAGGDDNAGAAGAGSTGSGGGGEHSVRYRLEVASDGGDAVWGSLEAYQAARHGSNWLTARYLGLMREASRCGANFRMHAVELWEDEVEAAAVGGGGGALAGRQPTVTVAPADPGTKCGSHPRKAGRVLRSVLVAGEIGYSVGAVYTSLSGFSARAGGRNGGGSSDGRGEGEESGPVSPAVAAASSSGAARFPGGVGTAQLALLGRWLQAKGYAFWSLGHCYRCAACLEHCTKWRAACTQKRDWPGQKVSAHINQRRSVAL